MRAPARTWAACSGVRFRAASGWVIARVPLGPGGCATVAIIHSPLLIFNRRSPRAAYGRTSISMLDRIALLALVGHEREHHALAPGGLEGQGHGQLALLTAERGGDHAELPLPAASADTIQVLDCLDHRDDVRPTRPVRETRLPLATDGQPSEHRHVQDLRLVGVGGLGPGAGPQHRREPPNGQGQRPPRHGRSGRGTGPAGERRVKASESIVGLACAHGIPGMDVGLEQAEPRGRRRRLRHHDPLEVVDQGRRRGEAHGLVEARHRVRQPSCGDERRDQAQARGDPVGDLRERRLVVRDRVRRTSEPHQREPDVRAEVGPGGIERERALVVVDGGLRVTPGRQPVRQAHVAPDAARRHDHRVRPEAAGILPHALLAPGEPGQAGEDGDAADRDAPDDHGRTRGRRGPPPPGRPPPTRRAPADRGPADSCSDRP